tara:strand:- start:455 stop:895 length:441 start_codon:yes stop_codon:yes gene_type:complete
MTYNNPFKSFDNKALVNLYRLLYNQNIANKEWFKTHNPLEGQIEMHDVNTNNYIDCMEAIKERLDTDLLKKLKDAGDYDGAHKVMTDWIEKIEQPLNAEVVEISYCHAFGWIQDREASVLSDEKLVRKIQGSKVMTAKEYRETLIS